MKLYILKVLIEVILKEKFYFISLRSCVENNDQIIKIKYENKITRDKLNHIFLQDEDKMFSFTFNKRVVKNNVYTIPYGF